MTGRIWWIRGTMSHFTDELVECRGRVGLVFESNPLVCHLICNECGKIIATGDRE